MPKIDINKLEIYAEKIFVFRDVVTDEEVEEYIDMHKNMDQYLETENREVWAKLGPWMTSSEVPHVYGTKRTSDFQNLSNTKNQKVIDFYMKYRNLFNEAGKIYYDKLGLDYKDGKHLVDLAQFHYTSGEEMGPHVDDYFNPDVDPIATGLLYMNSDKVGGDLYFREQDVFVESKAGTMVIFPCVEPFYHQSTLIKEGEKYHLGAGWKRNRGPSGDFE